MSNWIYGAEGTFYAWLGNPMPHQHDVPGAECFMPAHATGRKNSDVLMVGSHWIEWDDRPKAWQAEAWRELGLPMPTVQVDTGGKSVHSYWALKTPERDLTVWTERQKALVEWTGGDKSLVKPAQLMRRPGTRHPGTGNHATWRQLGEPVEAMELEACLIEPPTEPMERTLTLNEISEALSAIPSRTPGAGTYAQMRDVAWGVTAACLCAGSSRDEAAAMLRRWSPACADMPRIALAFEASRGITAGTLVHHAKAHGWTPPRGLQLASEAPREAEAEDFIVVRTGQPFAVPDPVWLIEALLPQGLTVLHGHGGTGKTSIVMDWLLHLARGAERWESQAMDGTPRRVCYCGGDMGLSQARELMGHVGWNLEAMEGDVGNPDITGFEMLDALEEWKAEHPRGVIAIDSWVAGFSASGINANDDQSLMPVLGRLKAMAMQGAVILICHRPRGQRRVKGSTSFENQSNRYISVDFAEGSDDVEIQATRRGAQFGMRVQRDWIQRQQTGEDQEATVTKADQLVQIYEDAWSTVCEMKKTELTEWTEANHFKARRDTCWDALRDVKRRRIADA